MESAEAATCSGTYRFGLILNHFPDTGCDLTITGNKSQWMEYGVSWASAPDRFAYC
jgi:hypothetical protein